MDGTGELFAPFLAAAKGDFRTVVVQYPTTKPLSYAELTSLVESQLPTREPFVLLAESFSGPIAVSLARRKPIGLVGLVLCAAFVRNPRPSLSHFLPLLGLISLRTIPARVLGYFFFGRFATRELCDDLKRVIRRVDAEVLHKRLQSIISVDLIDDLQRIEAPSLYMMATEDRLVPHSAATPFQQAYPRWKVATVTGPHLLLQSVPGEVVVALRRFLQLLN